MVCEDQGVQSKVQYKLVDIGANLAHPSFERDYSDVLARARKAGLKKIIVTGCSVKSSTVAGEKAQEHPGFLYCTAGVHPHDAKTFNEETIYQLRELLKKDNCVAVGECGLDFNRNFSSREDQLHAFEQQLILACELQKPLFIHEREASVDMVKLLKKHSGRLPPAVIHCFTGTAEEAQAYIDMGLYIGLTATCELIAAFMKEEPSDVAAVTTENAKRIYGLD
ncbi:hypothetical protein QR680_000044 [Steinernema hermaphroditum]|uniref:Deoxyribonuclease TATDN1 n=1 Tax=Steinernema hermaphroditum TaxID=289476 RepID=A0AA39LDD0_9BILA|nr:hypothetical protein QR680_000044 [Steinernema hermaphroditum]